MWDARRICITHDGSSDGELAARELQRYLAMINGGQSVGIAPDGTATRKANNTIYAGLLSSATIRSLLGSLVPSLSDDGYIIRFCHKGNADVVVLAGKTRRSLLYAVYHFIRETLDVRFHFDGEIVTAGKRSAISVEKLDILEDSPVAVRYWKPELLGDVSKLHSPWSWDFERWQHAIRWCVQNRMNGIEFTLFSQMNWGTDSSSEDQDDPYFTSEERVALLKRVIAYTQKMGMKAMINMLTAGTRLRYVGMHPEQAAMNTFYGSIYQGELCWRKGRKYLASLLKQYIDLYDKADGYIFQPDECQCRCKSCVTGKPFLSLFKEICTYVRSRDGNKSIYLWDWQIPCHDIVPQIPRDVIIINVHESQYIPEYASAGLAVIYMPCINWNTASFTTISPFPHLLKEEMGNMLKNNVLGFEGHHVSMHSGECNAQAYAECAWNPVKWDADRFLKEYIRVTYGGNMPYASVFQCLEKVWDLPFPYYFTSYMLDCYGKDYYDEGFVRNLTTGILRKVVYKTVTSGNQSYSVKSYQPFEVEEFFRLVKQRIGHLKTAAGLLAKERLVTDKQRFLQASVLSQYYASQWCYNKYRSIMVFQQGLGVRDKVAKLRSAQESRRHLLRGIRALNSLGKVIFGNAQWFQTRPCLTLRDVDPWISTQGIRTRWLCYYTSLISYPPFEPLASPKTLLNQIDAHLKREQDGGPGAEKKRK